MRRQCQQKGGALSTRNWAALPLRPQSNQSAISIGAHRLLAQQGFFPQAEWENKGQRSMEAAPDASGRHPEKSACAVGGRCVLGSNANPRPKQPQSSPFIEVGSLTLQSRLLMSAATPNRQSFALIVKPTWSPAIPKRAAKDRHNTRTQFIETQGNRDPETERALRRRACSPAYSSHR